MRNLILTLLIVYMVALTGCLSGIKPKLAPLDKITGPENDEEACEVIVSRVSEVGLFPSIGRECLRCELESNDGRTFQIALRYDQGKCGGDSASTLLDRFLVCHRSQVILWYDSSEDRYLPWEYVFYYRKSD